MSTSSAHGTMSRYTNQKCRCARCREAWRAGTRKYTDRLMAEHLAAGLTTKGRPRKTPYNQLALDLMARHGLRPDPRFVWRAE
jgi:hypothetical protein